MSLDDKITAKVAAKVGVPQSSIEIRRQEIQGRKAACVVIHDWRALSNDDLEGLVSEAINEALIEAQA